jgi:hypothetical protein
MTLTARQGMFDPVPLVISQGITPHWSAPALINSAGVRLLENIHENDDGPRYNELRKIGCVHAACLSAPVTVAAIRRQLGRDRYFFIQGRHARPIRRPTSAGAILTAQDRGRGHHCTLMYPT